MSDGVWTFPQKGIDQLVNDETIISKIEFHSIAFGNGADRKTLQRMADLFPGGKMSFALDAQALAKTFIDIVPNIY